MYFFYQHTFLRWNFTATHRRVVESSSGCDYVPFGLDPWLAISFQKKVQITHITHVQIAPRKHKKAYNLIGRSESASILGVSIHQMPGIHLLAWQAHYDLKDPKGLAGFLVDSDIKLIRAESGSPDESIRHKS